MSDRRFTLDTNVLVYAMDRQAGERHMLSGRIIAMAMQTDCWLTLQSISEFYAAMTRKRPTSIDAARDQALDWLAMFPTATATASTVRSALAFAASGRSSYWDALLVHTAAEAGCTAILTEDLTDGTVVANVRIVNPFGSATLSPAAEELLSAE
jgi:predicted nucleic acid-binding protein